MNRWGQLAVEHWSQWLPDRFNEIVRSGAPEAYFEELGEQVRAEIETLYQAMLPTMPADLGPSEAEGWRAMARRNAESQILAEMVLLPAEENPDDDLPDPASLTTFLADQTDAIYEAERLDEMNEMDQRASDRPEPPRT